MKPLQGIRVLTLATNLPGPVAVARLYQLGASVTKVEPPQGDALAHSRPDWYRALHQGQEVLRLNLKARRTGRGWSRTWLRPIC
jgi:crotonobetainyl-CoA:carnitine CoA-transferase CaiB-like acyl-CoA transferase